MAVSSTGVGPLLERPEAIERENHHKWRISKIEATTLTTLLSVTTQVVCIRTKDVPQTVQLLQHATRPSLVYVRTALQRVSPL